MPASGRRHVRRPADALEARRRHGQLPGAMTDVEFLTQGELGIHVPGAVDPREAVWIVLIASVSNAC